MIKRAAQFVPLKVDVDKNPKLAEKFNIRAVPAIVFVDADGKTAESFVGFKGPEDLVQVLDRLTLRRLASARAAAEESRDNLEAQAGLALTLAIRGDLEKAEAALHATRGTDLRGPTVGRAYNTLGDAYRRLKRTDNAVDAFERAERAGIDPVVRAYALQRLLEHYQRTGNTDRARGMATALTRLDGAPQRFVEKATAFLGR